MKKFVSLCMPLLLLSLTTGIGHAGPSLPQIDVQTGMITNGPLIVNQQFQWVNRAQTTCSVTDNGQWFGPDPISVPAASGGNTGTATATATTAGTFTWSSPCLEVDSPRAPIQGGH